MFSFLKDFISLFYPEVCLVCGEGLAEKDVYVCTTCIYKLPKTNYHLTGENTLFKELCSRDTNPEEKLAASFRGVRAAAAWCFYEKGNTVQQLVHELKYNGKWELGANFGKWYGSELKKSPLFNEAEWLVPVPLHPKKLKKRGYNQSAIFAEGLSKSMDIPVLPNALARVKETSTQTKKTKFDRWENVQDVFKAAEVEKLMGRHILLVDDIITTGATIEACVQALLEVPVASVSVASIGYTSDGKL